MGPACLIFDLDGTLVDSEALGAKAFCDLLPILELQSEAILAQYRGWKLANIINDIEWRHDVRLEEDFVASYRARVEVLFQESLEAFPGVHEALAQIDVPMCIASSGPFGKIESALKKTGLAPFFGSKVFSSYEVGSWKPDPGLFLFAAAAMKADPSRCLVIEDSEVGIAAAKAAGMAFLRFTGGDSEIGPSVTNVNSFAELPRKIARLFN